MIFYGLIGVTLIAGLLLSYLISVEVTRPIIELNKATKEVVATKFKDDINPNFIDEMRMDEIGQLAINFNLAIRKIRRSIKIIQDKSESLQAKNQQLLENEETLKMISAQKDKFLSIISHDMRAPLSSIISFLDYYKDNFKNFSEAEIEFVSSNLNTHVKKVVEMLDGLLMWSRSQTGEIQMNLQPIDLAQIITDTIAILNQSAVSKKIRIRKKIKLQQGKIARLVVYRSNKFLYAQAVDDSKGVVLTQANTAENVTKYSLSAGRRNSLSSIMKSKGLITCFLAVAISSAMHAQTITSGFGSGTNYFEIEFVKIGNPGNAADDTGLGLSPTTTTLVSMKLAGK